MLESANNEQQAKYREKKMKVGFAAAVASDRVPL